MTRFSFWQRWLVVACATTGLFGLSLMVFETRLLPLFPEAIARIFWGRDVMPESVVAYHRFVHAVLGATIAGWSVVLGFVAHGPFHAREPWAWNAIAASVATWFVLDTGVSLALGVWPNALLNLASASALVPPLVFTRRDFA